TVRTMSAVSASGSRSENTRTSGYAGSVPGSADTDKLVIALSFSLLTVGQASSLRADGLQAQGRKSLELAPRTEETGRCGTDLCDRGHTAATGGSDRQPADDRPQAGQVPAADQLAAVPLGEFACGGCEVVVGHHHGAGAVLHRRAGDDLLDCCRTDRPGLTFALHGKSIGPVADDEVDTPVAGDRRHDDRHTAGAGDPGDVVLELPAGHRRGRVLARGRRGDTVEHPAEKM